MDKNKIAGVLEDAARLYRDEKVEWCSGSWVEVMAGGYYLWDVDLGLDSPGMKLSVCAEGALLRAAGASWQDINHYTTPSDLDLSAPWAKSFNEARLVLARKLTEERGRSSSVHGWNDSLIGSVKERKEEVIDRFEAVAKELRNG